MREEIKQRIDQIRRGEVPEGYKKTKVGVVPEEWEETTLSEYLFVNNDKNENLRYGKEDVFSISGDLGIVNQIDLLGRSYAGASVAPYGVVYPNDVVYTKSPLKANPYGIIKTNLTENVGIVSTLYAIFHCKNNVCPKFVQDYFSWDHRLNNYLFPIVNIGAKHDMKISDENSLKGVVVFPPLAEQEKIAEILQTQDKVIELQQKKIDELKRLKKVYLSKMFPKKGCNVPEIRFPGFTDPWEQRKLGDVCQITMGQSPDGATYSDVPSDYILVQGNADLKNGWVFPRVWTTQKTKTAEAGDLIMSVRAPAGAMGKTNYNVVLGRGVAGIKGNEFIYQTLVKMDEDGYWKKLAAGSTFESINSDVISNAEIAVPQDIDEQEKLGAYFHNLDNLITLHQRKLDEEQKKKKALMQLLLTGIVRTV